MNRNISQRMFFHHLNNTRDLGGIRTKDGKFIKKNLLIRSGQLFSADEHDLQILKHIGLKKIYDLRSSDERREKPDPQIDNVVNIHLPIARDMSAGISRDQKSDAKVMDMMLSRSAEDPEFALRYMSEIYKSFVTDDFSISQYLNFIDRIADERQGAVLWHCAAGKDRAGFATVLLLEILGVRREDILEDYLASNEFLAEEINQIINELSEKPGLSNSEDTIRFFFSARKEYLLTTYTLAEKLYGSMNAFIKERLKVSPEKEKYLKSLFLET